MHTVSKFLGGAAIAAMLLTAGAAMAQTTTTTGTTATTPGAPNTGEGGDTAANVLILTGSALVAAAGVMYLLRQRSGAY